MIHMAKRYDTVPEIIRDLTDDQEFEQNFKQQIASKQLSKTLFALRCKKGLTQKEMAERLDCTQSRISKLENTTVENIKMSDVLAYAQASDQSLTVSFQENMTVADFVKRHAIQIKKHLDDLAKVTDESDSIFSYSTKQ